MEKKKEHADFQNEYDRSSNIGKKPGEDRLKIKGDGDLKLKKDKDMKKEEDKEIISDILDDISRNDEEEE